MTVAPAEQGATPLIGPPSGEEPCPLDAPSRSGAPLSIVGGRGGSKTLSPPAPQPNVAQAASAATRRTHLRYIEASIVA